MKWLAILLTVIFTIAKLLGIVSWSWWLVFTPVIICAVVWFIVLVFAIILSVMK